MTITRKLVGSSVTNEDLNALNYLASQYIVLQEEILLTKDSYVGEYGSYTLDSSVNDNYTGNCKLNYTTSFTDVTYILELVYRNSNGESVVTKTVGVDGVFNVTAPSGYTYFEATAKIRVRNGRHTIAGYQIDLSASSQSISVGGSSTITATLTDVDDDPVADAEITVTVGSSSSTITTNSSGVATYTFNASARGSHTISMSYEGVTSSITILVAGLTTVTTLSGSDVNVDSTISLTGTLKQGSTGLTGKSVKIYRDNVLADTVTTSTGGAFSYSDTNTSSAGTIVYKAVFEGDSTYEGSEATKQITVSKINTSLAIDVPLVLVYSDQFNITGTLKDAGNNLLNNKTVDLYVGNTKVDSGTTNSSGIVQFTRTPVSMGTHSFQLKFDGDSKYNNSNSSTVSRQINKETSVLTLDNPANNLNVYGDDYFIVQGILTDNDGEALPGKSVVMSENGNTIHTFTTTSNGSFVGQMIISIIGLSVGSHSLKFEFVADDYYTGSSVTRTVNVVNHSYALTCSASASTIISGNDVIITGNLTRDGSNWGSQTVTLYDGSTSLGTATTDSSGNYSKTLSGLALGSHTIKAVHTKAESSTVTVTVTDHIYALSLSASSSTITDAQSVTLTGQLIRDNVGMNGQTIKILNGQSLVDETTTNSSGQFSVTLTGASLGVGSFSFTAYHQSSDTESSAVSVTVTPSLVPDSITLSGTASIIQSGGTSTVTATLKDGSTVCPGFTLSYEVKKGSTVISSGSDTTDSNGQVALTYTGTGVGDVDIVFKYGISLQETYVIEDCTFYDPLTSTPKNNWIIDTGMSISSDSTGTTISGSTTKYMKLQVDLTNFEMEWDYISGSGVTPIGIQTWKGSNWVCYGTYNNNETRYVFEGTSKVYKSTSLKQNATYKYTVNNGTHSWYVDDELIQSVSAKSGSGTFYIGVYVSANCTSQKLKNVKIKPL